MKSKVLLIMSLLLIVALQSCKSNRELIKLREYYKATEILLDTIAIQQPDYFLDILMEQDVYDDYINASIPCSVYNYKNKK